MPNYAAAIPPEKLDTIGLRRLYDKIAEFLPAYLNYNKIEPLVTRGDYSNLSPLDTLDVIPTGKVLAPLGAMVINPRTISKFKQLAEKLAKDINVYHAADVANPEYIKQVKQVAGYFKARYPKLFSRLSSIKVVNYPQDNTKGEFIPELNSILLSSKLENVDKMFNIFAHELRHLAQQVYNSPVKKFFMPEENLNLTDYANYMRYFNQPLEADARRFASTVGEFIRNVYKRNPKLMGTKYELAVLKAKLAHEFAKQDPDNAIRLKLVDDLVRKLRLEAPKGKIEHFYPREFWKLYPAELRNLTAADSELYDRTLDRLYRRIKGELWPWE